MGSRLAVMNNARKRPATAGLPEQGLHFSGGSQSAFNRAIHIALPAKACVLAGKHDPSMRSGQPQPELRVELRVEVGIASLGPRIVLPTDHSGSHQSSRCRAKPLQGFHKTLDTTIGNELPCLRAGRSAGKQRQDARASPLLLVSIPDRTNQQLRSVGARTPAWLPEPPVELQQRFRRLSISQALDRLALK